MITFVKARDAWCRPQVLQQPATYSVMPGCMILVFDKCEEMERMLTRVLHNFCRRLMSPSFNVTLITPGSTSLLCVGGCKQLSADAPLQEQMEKQCEKHVLVSSVVSERSLVFF